MYSSAQFLALVKKASWNQRQEYLSDGPKNFINAYSLYGALQAPKDWLAIADKCSKNPNHEHYGKEPEAILEIWNTKKEVKAKDGNTLDDYIKLKIEKKDFASLTLFKQIEIDKGNLSLFNKTEQFDKFYEDKLKRLEYIASEVWLTSNVGVNLRCDSLFFLNDPNSNRQHGIVMEWKSLDKVSMSNHFDKLIGPMKGYDDCDKVKFTIQTHLYRYILERYGIFNEIVTMIWNFNTLAYQNVEQAFVYDKSRIEDLIAFGHENVKFEPKQTKTDNNEQKTSDNN